MSSPDERTILDRAATRPNDVQARIDAAYHCDAHRTEEEAVVHYDAAWILGIPTEQRREFMLGYGSTLKNVGRLGESESILRQAILENPKDKALPVFLALTLNAAGSGDHAVAQLLDVLLDLEDPEINRYERALVCYADELRRK